jgi:predicted NAD/FAD-dependent oxidoreductase
MSALTRHLADSLTSLPHAELHAGTPIASLKRAHNGWQLVDAGGTAHGPYDHVVISAPPPQAYTLVAEWDDTLAAACQTRKQRACWAGWAIFDGPLPALPGVDPDWQMARVEQPALRQILNIVSRNQTKPGRNDQPESVSLLAQLDWSEAHLEQSADDVAEQLVAALKDVFPASQQLPTLLELGAHRWRYAQPAAPCKHTYLYSENGLSLCGDSFRDGRIEDAWLSGHGLGEALIVRSI